MTPRLLLNPIALGLLLSPHLLLNPIALGLLLSPRLLLEPVPLLILLLAINFTFLNTVLFLNDLRP